MEKVVIGIDGGTTAVKAVAFSLEGKLMASHHQNVPVVYGTNGQAEQDMEAIWDAVVQCLASVREQLPDSRILGIGLTGQGDGAWLVDSEGSPLGPAKIWLDGRAASRVDEWVSSGKARKVLTTTGTTIFGGLFPVLYEEMLETEPEIISQANAQLYCKDWLRFKLTGVIATDYTEASRTYLDVATVAGYSDTLLEELDQAGARKLLPSIKRPHELGGLLTKQAAELTGIPAGTPVGVGMIDVAVTGMGLGAIDDGQGWLILGTTGFVGTLLPSLEARRSENSMVVATGIGTQVLEFFAPMTGTPNLDWIRTVLGLEAKSWAEIEQQAEEAGPGAGGVIYLPYASPGGERAPFLDTFASASWMGLSLTTPASQVLRAVYEGVAFSLIECADVLQMKSELIVSGGGFRSDLLCQILADATGQIVLRQDAPEAGARGAAVLALVSAGVADDIHRASAMLESGVGRFEPNPQMHAIYQQTHQVYLEARKAIQPVWPQMRQLRTLNKTAEPQT